MTRRSWLAACLGFPLTGRASILDPAWRSAGFDPGGIQLLLEGPGERRSSWANPEAPIPPGSLLKPFAALAYASSHGFRYPSATCSGEGCWLPSGHGKLGVEDALAQSCNVYFRALSREVPPAALAHAAVRLGLPAPPDGAAPDSYWGLGDQWRIPPARLLHAYGELHRRAADPGAGPVLEGLRRAASSGTASGVGGQALAKTGTAPCVHRGSNGDGYCCALFPADKPRYTMLLQLHGRTGREAARAAGVVLHRLARGG